MGVCKSTPFFAKSVILQIFFFKLETTISSRKVNVNAIVTSNFSQIVRKATCLMAMTQNNSNNSLTPELNDLCSKKEIIWMNSLAYRPRLKKDLYSKFRLGPKIRTSRKAQSGIQAKIHS